MTVARANDFSVIQLGNLSLDLRNYRVIVADRYVELTVQEQDVLGIFLRNPNRVIHYDNLTQELWGGASRPLTRHLNVLIHRLRAKIEGSWPYQLKTVRGRGYGLLTSALADESDDAGSEPRAGP